MKKYYIYRGILTVNKLQFGEVSFEVFNSISGILISLLQRQFSVVNSCLLDFIVIVSLCSANDFIIDTSSGVPINLRYNNYIDN